MYCNSRLGADFGSEEPFPFLLRQTQKTFAKPLGNSSSENCFGN